MAPKTIYEHKETLLPALDALHGQLLIRETAMRAAEALVGALGIEIEGLSVTADDNTPVDHDKSDTVNQDIFKEQLEGLLLRNDLNDGQPFNVAERSDILFELRRLRASSGGSKGGWIVAKQVKENTSLMNAAQDDMLDTLFGANDGPTNTSPPFRPAKTVRDLKERAQNAVTKLNLGIKNGE
ncbi:hypothetical protein H0H87_010284, partial [Tephrocybe sp. NHM501043]